MSKSKRVNTFAVGDRVSWESQAGGHWKKKVGIVVEVVASQRNPKMFPSVGNRLHESYVVEVVHEPKLSKTPRVPRKPERYWPIVKNLRLVRRGSTSAVAAAPPVVDPAPASEVTEGRLDAMEKVVESDPVIQQAIEHRVEEVTAKSDHVLDRTDGDLLGGPSYEPHNLDVSSDVASPVN